MTLPTPHADPQAQTEYRQALYALREALGYRRPLVVAAMALREHQHEFAEQFGFLSQAPDHMRQKLSEVLEDQLIGTLRGFGMNEETLGRLTRPQLRALLQVFSDHIAGRGPFSGDRLPPEVPLGSEASAAPAPEGAEAQATVASPGPEQARQAAPAPAAPKAAKTAAPAAAPAQPAAPQPLAPKEPHDLGSLAAEPELSAQELQPGGLRPAPQTAAAPTSAPEPTPEQAPVRSGTHGLQVRRATHADEAQLIAAQEQIPSAGTVHQPELVWPSGEGDEAWEMRQHYLSVYLASVATTRGLGRLGAQIGEARMTLARTLDPRVRSKRPTIERLWGKLEPKVRAYLRSHPEALRLNAAAPEQPEDPTAASHEYLLAALIVDARAVMERREIARLLSTHGAERDLAERLASGMRHRTLSADEVQAFSLPLRPVALEGRVRRQQAGQAWNLVARVLRETPMSKEVLVGLASAHQLDLSPSELRALQTGENVSQEVIARATELVESITPSELEQARQQCYDRVRDSDHPNPVGLAWVREAQEEVRQAMRRDAAATRQRVADLGLTQKAQQLETTTHISDARLSVTPGEAARIIEAVRPIASEPIQSLGTHA